MFGGMFGNLDADTCPFETFNDRSAELNAVCCTGGDCVDKGLPPTCSFDCAVVYNSLYDDCYTLLFLARRCRSVREPPRESFNIMVVGEAGLGKTTLLESFFQSFKDDEAAFALFERKETAIEIETRRQLAEAGAQRNAAERELQACVESAQYHKAGAKQKEIEQLTTTMVALQARLKELSAADERQRNELRALREGVRSLRLEMKRAADQSAFTCASERQLEAALFRVELNALDPIYALNNLLEPLSERLCLGEVWPL